MRLNMKRTASSPVEERSMGTMERTQSQTLSKRCGSNVCRRVVWLLIAITSSAALVLSSIASLGCRLFKIETFNANGQLIDKLSFGLWASKLGDGLVDGKEFVVTNAWFGCTSFGAGRQLSFNYYPDEHIKTIQGLSVVVCILSIAVYGIIIGLSFWKFQAITVQIAASISFLLSLSSALYFLALLSDLCQDANNCQLDVGGKFCIIASFLWMITGNMMLLFESMFRSEVQKEVIAEASQARSYPERPTIKSIIGTPTTVSSLSNSPQRFKKSLPPSQLSSKMLPIYGSSYSLEMYNRDTDTLSHGESMASWSFKGECASLGTSETPNSV